MVHATDVMVNRLKHRLKIAYNSMKSTFYFLSDGTVIDFIKQLLGWIIVPFLSAFIKPKD